MLDKILHNVSNFLQKIVACFSCKFYSKKPLIDVEQYDIYTNDDDDSVMENPLLHEGVLRC